jgi:pimeloyl-ACP methyl ester carboxylesterase
MNPKIVFIHGMFQNPKSWDHWVSFFENTGFDCEAPAWPFHEGEPADLRAKIPPGRGKLSLRDLHEHYRAILAGQAEPVVIGHSLGGLLAQKLLADGLVRAAVGIASVAPNRMLALDWGFLRNSASITNPFAGDDPFLMTRELFHQNFANTMERAASDAAWQAFAVHESRQVLRDVMGEEGEIDLELPHNPLLLVGAEKDEIIPASLVRRNAHAYKDERSHHEYKEFTGRGHWICGEPGWEEVAVSVSNWLEGHLSALRA